MIASASSGLEYATIEGRLLKRVFSDLADKRTVWLVAPAGTDLNSVWLSIERELFSRDFSVEEVRLSEATGNDNPLKVLDDSFGLEWSDAEIPRVVSNLTEVDGLPNLIRVLDFEVLDQREKQLWIGFLPKWGLANEKRVSRGLAPCSLFLSTSDGYIPPELPTTNLYLSIHWWWGAASMLEIQMVCRALDGSFDRATPEGLWRENILAALGSKDVDLIDELWELADLDADGVFGQLAVLAEKRGWTSEQLREMGAERVLWNPLKDDIEYSTVPPRQLRRLWAAGALVWNFENGIQLHPAALAALGFVDEIKHRLWFGQIRLAMPIIDSLRLALCHYMNKKYGPKWPLRWDNPVSQKETDELRRNSMACQWGYLEHLFRRCPKLRSEGRLANAIGIAHRVRNELAHYRTILFKDFRELWHSASRLNF